MPGVLFFLLAASLQILEALEAYSLPREVGEGMIAAAFLWVFVGPLVLPFTTLIGWFAVRKGAPELRQQFWIATVLSVIGYILMLDFMRMS